MSEQTYESRVPATVGVKESYPVTKTARANFQFIDDCQVRQSMAWIRKKQLCWPEGAAAVTKR